MDDPRKYRVTLTESYAYEVVVDGDDEDAAEEAARLAHANASAGGGAAVECYEIEALPDDR
ncbi:MAG: hypothetical protein VX464_11590 [Pseudomonadota bacterium]|nr:hypothetical protein [Pseudomonadota bacterium]